MRVVVGGRSERPFISGDKPMGGSGGVVNSLDFCPASLKSLGSCHFRCILSVRNESGSEFANFTLPTLKAFLEAHGQNVSGNKQ